METINIIECGDAQRRAETGHPVAIAKTAAYTVPIDTPNGTIFTNSGASGSVTFTLPVTGSTPGSRITGKFFIFAKVTNQNLVINPGTGAQINGNTASTGVFQNVTSSAATIPACTVTAISETSWIVNAGVGTWANA